MPLFPVQAQTQQGNITYQPDIINQVSFSIVNRAFTISYGSYYMAFRPYFQWNGTIYTAQQALTFLNNQYPNARYAQIMERVGRTIHWGFNYTNLPQAIQTNLQAIYFRLEDYNFPLNNIDLETILVDDKNYTTIAFPKANLKFDFSDIISQDFQVQINQTGIAIYNVAGKPDLYLDPITYSAPTITVIGYNATVPCTFTDLYNADVAGGWGVVSILGTKQFQLNCNVVVGNGTSAGTSFFNDTAKQVMFVNNLTSGQIHFHAKTYTTITFGSVTDATNHLTNSGVEFAFSGLGSVVCQAIKADGTFYFYSCHFQNVGTHSYWLNLNGNGRIWNCRVLGGSSYEIWLYNVDSGVDIFNVSCEKVRYGVELPSGNIQNLYVLRAQQYLYFQLNAPANVTNLYGRGATNQGFRVSSISVDQRVIDADVDLWTFSWEGTSTGEVYRQYHFDLLVQNSMGSAIENATLSLLNNAGTEVFTDTLTNSSGMQDTQTVTRGFYNQTGGDTLYDSGPFLLNVTKTGYQSYVQNFTLTEKTDWTITLSATDTETANNAALIWSLLFGSIAFGLFLLWRKVHA